jgi:hypothetical protein
MGMKEQFSKKNIDAKTFVIFITIAIFLLFAYLGAQFNWLSDFNLFINLIGGIFALFIGLLSLLRFYTKKNRFNYLFLGLGFLAISVVEIVQVLVVITAFRDLFSIDTTQAFPISEVLSRVFLSLILFLSWLFRKEDQKETQPNEKLAYVGLLLGISTTIILVSLTTQIFANYQQYMLSIIGQTVSLMIYILAITGYIRSKGIRTSNFDFWIIFSLSFSIISQFFFLPYLNLEYKLMLNLATLAKFVSYIVLLLGFLNSIYEIYKKEEKAQKELERKNLILNETKKKVEEAYMLLRSEKWQLTKTKEKSTADRIMKDILNNK